MIKNNIQISSFVFLKENAFPCGIDKKQFIMLTTVEYLSLLREYMRKNSAKYGISRMGIFGSVARGEQREGSDVDICVEIDRPSIFTLVHIKEELEKLLKCPVDVVRLRNNMDELLRGCINKDGIYV